DERSLEVDAREVALFGQLRQQAGLLDQEVHVVGDRRGDDGGGAVQAVGADGRPHLLCRPGEGRPTAPVVVDVDEPGDQPVAGYVDDLTVPGSLPQTSGQLRPGGRPIGDPGAFDDDPAVIHDPGGKHHLGTGENLA